MFTVKLYAGVESFLCFLCRRLASYLLLEGLCHFTWYANICPPIFDVNLCSSSVHRIVIEGSFVSGHWETGKWIWNGSLFIRGELLPSSTS